MRAAVLKALGPPVCGDYGEPEAGEGEVVLEMAAAASTTSIS